MAMYMMYVTAFEFFLFFVFCFSDFEIDFAIQPNFFGEIIMEFLQKFAVDLHNFHLIYVLFVSLSFSSCVFFFF